MNKKLAVFMFLSSVFIVLGYKETFADYDLLGVAQGNGKYVVVGRENLAGAPGVILSSSDGINWTKSQIDFYDAITAVVWGKDKFIAIAKGGQMLYSYDGLSWSVPAFNQISVNSIVWGNNQFVAAGAGVISSLDGVSWTTQLAIWSDNYTDVKWTGRQFVIAGGRFSQGQQTVISNAIIMRSSDGQNWDRKTYSTIGSLYRITCDTVTQKFYAVYQITTILVSNDLVTCIYCPVSWPYISSIAFGNNLVVAVGSMGEILSPSPASDTSAWSWQNPFPIEGNLHSVIWSDSQFIAVGDNCTILFSKDGKNWVNKSITTTINIRNTNCKAANSTGNNIRIYGAKVHCIISKPCFAILKLYDMRGNFVKTLVNARRGAGECDFDVPTKIPHGRYVLLCHFDQERANYLLLK